MDTARQIVQWHQRMWQSGRNLSEVRRHLARRPDDLALRTAERKAVDAVLNARRQIERVRSAASLAASTARRGDVMH